MDPMTLVVLATIVASAVTITLGTALPALMEGKALHIALESIARQPQASNDIRNTLILGMALVESTAIYCLLICLVLLFANPLIDLL